MCFTAQPVSSFSCTTKKPIPRFICKIGFSILPNIVSGYTLTVSWMFSMNTSRLAGLSTIFWILRGSSSLTISFVM